MELEDKIVSEQIYEIEEKFYWGNPRIEVKEGFFIQKIHTFIINNKKENQYDENDLEIIKQYIWEINKSNKLIKSRELLCKNVPNKISISEYLSLIGIYLSYIQSIKILKSCVPNNYYINLKFKNVEYANVFYNTFNYSRLNFMEKEYLVYSEIVKMDDGFNKEKLNLNEKLDNSNSNNNIMQNKNNYAQTSYIDNDHSRDKAENNSLANENKIEEKTPSKKTNNQKINVEVNNSYISNLDLYEVKRARSKKYKHNLNFDKPIQDNSEGMEDIMKSPKETFYYIKRKNKYNQEELEEINTNINVLREQKIRKISNNYEYLKLNNKKNLINKNKSKAEIIDNDEDNFSTENSNTYDTKLCPICLEYLDGNKCEKSIINNNMNKINEFLSNPLNKCSNQINVSGFITMLCGHTFHIECSLKFEDEKCPICRYYISPVSISTCSLCTNEDDLWLCLICGNINCASEGNEHRKQHYIDTGHVYAKKLGDSSNNTFDLSRNINLNSWFQHSIFNEFNSNPIADFEINKMEGEANVKNVGYNAYNNIQTEEEQNNKTLINNVEEEKFINIFKGNQTVTYNQQRANQYSKNSKDKLDYIITEYNSIISSQLESQRFFYLDRIKLLEDKYSKKQFEMDKEYKLYETELQKNQIQSQDINKEKIELLCKVKENECSLKSKLKELTNYEIEYGKILEKKNLFIEKNENKEKYVKKEIKKLENEIINIKNETKDLKIHIDIKKNSKINDISGASFRTVEFKK